MNELLNFDMTHLQTHALRACEIVALRAILSPDEAARADRYHRPQDQVLSIAARALLRQGLSRHFDVLPKAWRFGTDGFGKPHLSPLQDDGSVWFSVSHADGLVVCAISRHDPVGIDAEAIEGSLATTPTDHKAVLAWTAREAIAKALGRGLQLPFERIKRVATDDYRVDLRGLAGVDGLARWRVMHPALSPRHLVAVAVPW